MTAKARPFPAQQDYSPAVRQYLNRLSHVEAGNESAFAALQEQVSQLHTVTTALEANVNGLTAQVQGLAGEAADNLAAIEGLQQESAAHAEAIDLLNSRYSTVRADLDGALVAITGLDRTLEQATLDIEADTLAIGALQTNVTALQQQESATAAGLVALASRLVTAESEIDETQTTVKVLQWTDAGLNDRLTGAESRIDQLVAIQAAAVTGFRLPLSASITGTVPLLVSSTVLPAGSYAAPQAYLGCPTTPTATATLSLVVVADASTLATIAVTGAMAWGLASAGFTLAAETALDFLLAGDPPEALAVLKGVVLTTQPG